MRDYRIRASFSTHVCDKPDIALARRNLFMFVVDENDSGIKYLAGV